MYKLIKGHKQQYKIIYPEIAMLFSILQAGAQCQHLKLRVKILLNKSTWKSTNLASSNNTLQIWTKLNLCSPFNCFRPLLKYLAYVLNFLMKTRAMVLPARRKTVMFKVFMISTDQKQNFFQNFKNSLKQTKRI